jgi:hypothetical protein
VSGDWGDSKERRRKARYQRYNSSAKGQQRRKRYEEKHPERKAKWSELMQAKARDRQ